MKIRQLPFAQEERTVLLRSVGSFPLERGCSVRLVISPAGVFVISGDVVGSCEQPDFNDVDWLTTVANSDAYVAEIVSTEPTVVLRVLTYDRYERWPDGRRIGVDDQLVEDARRYMQSSTTPDGVIRWLTEQFRLDANKSFSIVATGAGAAANQNAFRLVGATIMADVRLIDDRLVLERLTNRQPQPDDRLMLVQGEVSFVDATRLGQLTTAEREEVKRLSSADNAYLAIWEEYNALERAAAKKAASDIGWADYDRFTFRPDGRLEFDLVQHRRSDAFRDRIGRERVGIEAGDGVAFQEAERRGTSIFLIGEGSVSERGTILLTPARPYEPGTLPPRGRLAGAYTLDKVRIDRRNVAQTAITTGATFPVRQLALILGNQRPGPVGRARHHEPMSARVREILGGTPTDAQLQAIDLAINSRDLVLIQGPPGTGKTRVITAIQARLSEIHRDTAALDKRVLLTSYQHDAVGNLVGASNDGILPPVKLGRREHQEDVAYLAAWTDDLATRLDRRYKNVRPNEFVRGQRALQDRATAYRQQPFDVANTITLLTWLTGQSDLVGSRVARDARRLASRLEHDLAGGSGRHDGDELMMLARRLRTTPEAYADDGPDTARSAYTNQRFFDLLNDAQREKLERAALNRSVPDITVVELADLQRDILDRILDGRARASVIATMPEVEALLQRAIDSAAQEVRSSANPVDLAIEYFRAAVASQPGAIRESVSKHTRALAATCQQSASRQMRNAQTVPFGTVIVDEAARANPLDLMIPMSLAGERIILVGDHRQLPQLLDDDLVPQLSKRHDTKVVDTVLSRSLFERLFIRLRELGVRDGTPRAITLDRQFRTHPVLGAFVSEQFYAPFQERLTNGIDDPKAFAHPLTAFEGAVCAWIDVPAVKGGDHRVGTSIARPAEAQVVVEELSKGLQDASPEFTFGVITFYSGQETALWEAMLEKGLGVREGREYALNRSVPWLYTDRGLPRVRIGSVDAFQGREFDVVFLSTVRSNQRLRGHRDFGFLVLPNRLCVAMSRQRRLLIAVGDATMFTSPEGREAVPALGAFHDLTGGAHGLRKSS
ncbi:AAA domain-containing protein [Saccharopolyspora sp. NPDC050642]|uniref:DEAD/DEAH box helicase n=1 Tax=Saccharopolyspora sp. NPDC050642 TaxID=3157099 RepID=UPI0033ED4463